MEEEQAEEEIIHKCHYCGEDILENPIYHGFVNYRLNSYRHSDCPKMFGFYSEKAKMSCGSSLYSTIDNKQVEVTAVYLSIDQAQKEYEWDDKILVGQVARFIW